MRIGRIVVRNNSKVANFWSKILICKIEKNLEIFYFPNCTIP